MRKDQYWVELGSRSYNYKVEWIRYGGIVCACTKPERTV